MKDRNTIFFEGFKAHECGILKENNPYHSEPDYTWWEDGFDTSVRNEMEENESVFMQGDAAAQFEDELELAEKVFKNNTFDQNCAHLWFDREYNLAARIMPK